MPVSSTTPFPRRHPAAVLALFVVSVGAYGGIWLRRQARDFDSRLPDSPLRRFSTATLAVCVLDLVLFVGELALPDDILKGITAPVSALAGGLLLLGALRVRRRILHLAAEDGVPRPKVSLPATVLLNAAYLQWRINRYADSLRSSEPPASTPRFRDSRRLAWMASLGPALVATAILLAMVAVPIGVDRLGTSSYLRARERALHLLSPLPAEPTDGPEVRHPVLGSSSDLEIADAEKNRMSPLLDSVDTRRLSRDERRFLSTFLERNREVLEQIGTSLDVPGERTVSGPETEAAPSHLPRLAVARLLLADGLLELEGGSAADAIPAIRRLGNLARLYERSRNAGAQLFSAEVERHQLLLVAAAMNACLDAAASREVASTLLERPMELRLRDLLANDAAIFIEFERTEGHKITQELREEAGPWVTRRAGERVARGFLRYSTAGALDSLVLNAEVFAGRYGEMRSALELDVDEMSYLEKARSVAGRHLWILPAALRVVGDSRLGAAHALRRSSTPGQTGCGGGLPGDAPLDQLYEIARGPSGCELRYRLREDLASASRGELDLPPLSWPLGCR